MRTKDTLNKVKELKDMAIWLRDEVIDEDNWELNAVALGEVICRKLVRCGLLELKDGNYHILNAIDTTSTERKSGTFRTSKYREEWYGEYHICNECGATWMGDINYCPNCGVRKENDEE